MAKTRQVKFNIRLTTEVKDRIKSLMAKSGSQSMTEFMRKALATYEVIIKHHMDNGEIILKSVDGKEKQLLIY